MPHGCVGDEFVFDTSQICGDLDACPPVTVEAASQARLQPLNAVVAAAIMAGTGA